MFVLRYIEILMQDFFWEDTEKVSIGLHNFNMTYPEGIFFVCVKFLSLLIMTPVSLCFLDYQNTRVRSSANACA